MTSSRLNDSAVELADTCRHLTDTDDISHAASAATPATYDTFISADIQHYYGQQL